MQTCIARVLERGRSSGRGDDNIDVMRKRLETYEKETKRLMCGLAHATMADVPAAIIDIFAARSLVRTVDSTQPVDDVFTHVTALFQ